MHANPHATPEMQSLKEPIMQGLRKGSIMVAEALESRRVNKADRRREELKKMIKVVHEDASPQPQDERRPS